MNLFGKLSGYKTYITGGITILTAVGLYLTGDDTAQQAGQLVVTALLAMFIRHGVTTETSN